MVIMRKQKNKRIVVPLAAEFHGPYADEVARLAARLMLMTSTRKERWEWGHYIPFSKKYLVAMFGSKASAVKAAARQHPEIFEFNDSYCSTGPTTWPQSMRLNTKCRTGETKLYELRRLPHSGLDFNGDNSDIISQKLGSKFKYFWLPEEKPPFENLWQAYTWDRIVAEDYHYGRCDYGRFHSNFTAFKHRHHLQSSHPLVAIDVVSSQPLLLGYCASRHFHGPSVGLWIDICENGDIYTELGAMIGEPDRKKVKIYVMETLFSKIRFMEAHRLYIELRDKFPDIANYLLRRKSIHSYQAVAHDCQRLESQIMIDGAANDLAFPFITCHDEFIVPAINSEQTEATIRKHFRKRKISPKLKTTAL